MIGQKNQHLSIKKLVVLTGAISASILLSLPVLAQTSNGGHLPSDDRYDSQGSSRNDELNNDNKSPGQSNNNGTSQMNQPSTTGAGYPGNGVTPSGGTRSTDQQYNQSNPNGSSQMNQPSTTGAGYPGNGVTPNSGSSNSTGQYNNSGSSNSTGAQGVEGLW